MEYATAFVPAHTPLTGPVTRPGVEGSEYRFKVRAALFPQLLPAVTFSVPEVKDAEKLTVTDVVPCPVAMVALVGAVHV